MAPTTLTSSSRAVPIEIRPAAPAEHDAVGDLCAAA
jgi:hypothetical protein